MEGAEGPESSGIGAARRTPEVMGLGLEKADNMVPKLDPESGTSRGSWSQGWGPHIPKLWHALCAPLLTRVGTQS